MAVEEFSDQHAGGRCARAAFAVVFVALTHQYHHSSKRVRSKPINADTRDTHARNADTAAAAISQLLILRSVIDNVLALIF